MLIEVTEKTEIAVTPEVLAKAFWGMSDGASECAEALHALLQKEDQKP